MLRSVVVLSALLLITSCGGGVHKKHNHSSIPESANLGRTNQYFGCPENNGVIGVVNFNFDKYDVLDSAKVILDDAIKKCLISHLSKDKNMRVMITGHTDKHGAREYNIALGNKRSYSVKSYIVEGMEKAVAELSKENDAFSAIKSDDLKNMFCTTSKGKEYLINLENTTDADMENRRAEIEFVSSCN